MRIVEPEVVDFDGCKNARDLGRGVHTKGEAPRKICLGISEFFIGNGLAPDPAYLLERLGNDLVGGLVLGLDPYGEGARLLPG